MTVDPSILLFFEANRRYLVRAAPAVHWALVKRSILHFRWNAHFLWLLAHLIRKSAVESLTAPIMFSVRVTCVICAEPCRAVLLTTAPTVSIAAKASKDNDGAMTWRYEQMMGLGFECPNGHDCNENPPIVEPLGFSLAAGPTHPAPEKEHPQ